MSDTVLEIAGVLFGIGLAFLGIATWLTHVIYCFQHSEWGFLIAGALFFPVANVHGFGLWFGWWG